MASTISIDDGETRARARATPNGRFEALKSTAVPLDYQQELGDDDLQKIMDHDLYEATKSGDVNEFMNALEMVSKSRKLALSLIFDQVTPSGNSLLHVAASFGSDDVMELILIHFPHIMTRKNSSEDTPLHVAVQDKRFNATKNLIHRETNSEIIYWKNKDGKSPLYLAVEKYAFCYRKDNEQAEFNIFELLLQKSARDEAYAVKIQGMSPILAVIENLNTDVLKKIIDGLPKLLHVRDENGGTPLHVAASVSSDSAVELLLRKCPHLALQTDKNGSYPIHIACEANNFRAIEALLKDTWPDLAEIKNKKRQNILHVAAKGGNDRAVDRVLKKDLAVDRVLKKDRAVDRVLQKYLSLKKCSEPDTIEKLVNADTIEKLVNAKDDDGNTPLHLASMHNHCEVMRSLTMDKRIDLGLRNNDGLTALDVAMESRSSSTRNSALVGRAILIVADVPRSEGQDILSLREQGSGASKSSRAEWIKDQVNTLLLVATLVASVTFTAGLTLPGGYNASGDLHPGMATMLHHGMFQVFVIANMVAMYSSILAVVVLLWGLNRDYYVAELAYLSAGPLLLMALTGMSVAFFAAITVVVSKLTWLGSLVPSVGVLYLAMVVVVLAPLIFPSSTTTMRIVVFYYRVKLAVEKFVAFFDYNYNFIRIRMIIRLRMIRRGHRLRGHRLRGDMYQLNR